MQRIAIIGTSGSGKTTLAREISQRLAIPHIELDYLYWQPNWTETPKDIFRQQLSQKLTNNAWVVDGNYALARDIIWSQADTLIWLNYSFPLVLWRITRRTFQRVIKKKAVCNGNYETWQIAFSKNSMILYVLQTYHQRLKEYSQIFNHPSTYPNLKFVELRTPAATQDWLSKLPIA
ncbi:MAG TPA: adenylate kinase [Nostocaceae cyanobacterium]|nr:adenylate kinase [Nostocaceae cyanobacterium]